MVSSDSRAGSQQDAYQLGWRALNKLIRRGFSWSGNERHCVYWQAPDGRFRDVSRLSGADFPEDGRAASVVDWDLDGDVDLVVTARTGPRVRLLVNRSPPGNGFLQISPRGTRTNPDGVGARVVLELDDGTRLSRSLSAGSGYLAQSSAWVHFGLGGREPLRAVVRWPGGGEEAFDVPGRDRFLVLVEGSGEARELRRPAAPIEAQGRPCEPPPSAGPVRMVALDPVPVPAIQAEGADGRALALFGVRAPGQAARGARLVVLSASWCAPCREELARLTAGRAALAQAGVGVLGLALDQDEAGRAAARAAWEAAGSPFPLAFPDAEGVAVLDGLQGVLRDSERPLALPTSFLLDGDGRLVALYTGAVAVEQVLADRRLCGLDPGPRRAAAAASAGIWLDPPEPSDPGAIAGGLERRGLPQAAREVERAALTMVEGSVADVEHAFGLRAGRAGHLEEAIARFQRALAADPRHVASWHDLGVALHRAGRAAQAVDAYRQGVLHAPEDATLHHDLALALLATGAVDLARAELEWLRARGSPLAEDLEIAFARPGGVR